VSDGDYVDSVMWVELVPILPAMNGKLSHITYHIVSYYTAASL